MYFFITFLTAVALSLDAFSLAVIYGTVLKKKKIIILLSIIVGIFHFFMPLLGFIISNLFISKIIVKTNIISFIIFLILGIQMLFSKNNDNDLLNLSSLPNVLLFAFTVSIDSFSVGIAISSQNKTIFIPIMLFSIISFLFTYVGLNIGNKLKKVFGDFTTKVGGLILIALSIYYWFM